MADDIQTPPNGAAPEGENADSSNVTTLDALQLDGKGQKGLEDAKKEELPESQKAGGEDMSSFANVQSASRATFEEMNAGAPHDAGATPTNDNVQHDVAVPTEPDNHVDAKFENPHPPAEPAAVPQVVETAAPPAPPAAIERPQERVDTPQPDTRPEAAAPAPQAAAPVAEAVAAPAVVTPVVVPPVELEPEDPTPKVAQTPSLDLGISNGVEDLNGNIANDQKMKLDINPQLHDTDGGAESLTVTIKGVPDGFSFDDASGNPLGTKGTDGVWTFNWPTNAPDLYLVRPVHYSGDLTFEVTARAAESSSGSTASITKTLPVHVEAVADQPPLTVSHVAGMENTWISLGGHITTQLADADGSETLAVYITPKAGTASANAMPTGTQLNHGTLVASDTTLEDGTVIKAGSWKVDPADLADLKVRAPDNVSTDFTFEVRSTTTEAMNGDTAVRGPLDLHVDIGIVDPSVAGSGSGNEDTWIALDLSAHVNSADNTEHLTVWLENLPADAELRYASSHAVLTPNGDGRYDVSNALQNLEVHWKTANQDSDISFKLRAVAQDVDALNTTDTPDRDTGIGGVVTGLPGSFAPDTTQATADVTVVVKAVADAPTLAANGIGVEDKYAALHITSGLVDTDGTESLTVYVQAGANSPAGMVVKVYDSAHATLTDASATTADITLADGTVIPAGSFALSAADAANNVRIYGLDANSDGANHTNAADFHVKVTSVTTEAASDAQTAVRTAQTSVDVPVTVFGDADTPTTAVVDGRQVITEDSTYNLHTAIGGGNFALESTNGVDGADGSQSIISYQVKPIETGSRLFVSGVEQTLPAADANGERYWSLDPADVAAGRVTVAGPADWGSLDSALDKHFDMRSVTREADYAADTSGLFDGLSRSPTAISAWDRLTLGINPVADTPSVDTNAAHSYAIGVEDKYAAIASTSFSGHSTDADGSEALSYYIQPGANAPTGMVVKILAADGSLTDATRVDADLHLTDGTLIKAGSYLVTTSQAAGHVRVYGLDANSDGANHNNTADFHVSVTAVATDGNSTAGTSVDVPVTVFGDADTPTVAVVDGRQVITEDSTYNLHAAIGGGHFAVESTNGEDSADGSQSIISYQVKPIETGSRLFVSGVEQTLPAADANGDRYWTVSAANITANNVTVAGPANWGDWTLDKHFDIRSVTQEADSAANTSGLFDGLSRVTTAVSAWDQLTLGITPVPDAPNLTASGVGVGVEDKYAVLNIASSLVDTDGSENLTIYVKDLPTGATLNHGTLMTDAVTLQNGTVIAVGSYQLAAADLPGLQIQNLVHDSDYGAADFQISVLAVSRDQANATYPTGQEAVTSLTPTITIFGDADKPNVTVVEPAQTINEDAFYDLRTLLGDGTTHAVEGALVDLTRESLDQYHVKPIEAGSQLTLNGVAQALPGAGYWTVSAADVLAGKVAVGGAANWSSQTNQLHFDIQVRTIEADNGANTSSLTGTGLSRSGTAWSDWDRLTLQVNPVADGTTVGAQSSGNEDTVITVAPTFTLTDTDGSESLTGPVLFTSSDPDMISGALKVGSTVITPTDMGGGVYQWSIPNSAIAPVNSSAVNFTLSGVTFTPSLHNANDMTYTIQVTTSDTTGAFTHVTTATGCSINVTAVADQPTISVGAADGANVVHLTEDTALNLGLLTNLVDAPNANPVGGLYNPDPEHFSYIGLEGIPTGWTLLKTHNGVTSQVSVTGGVANLTNETLSEISLKPPTNLNWASAADAATPVFTFKSISAETENSSTATNSVTFKVTVDAVADTPTLQVTNVRVNEDTRVALDIRTAVTDTDGSESISDVFLGNAPAGTAFYDAASGGNAIGTLGKMVGGVFTADATGDVWRFAKADLAHLYLQPKHDSNVDFDLSVTARTTESSNGSYADSVTGTLHVDIKGISDGAYIPAEHLNGATLTASGNEDTIIDPGFGSYHPADVDGSETLSVVLRQIPDTVTFSMTAGNEKFAKYLGVVNGHEQWSIDPNHLADVRFKAGHDVAGDFTVKLDLITTENDGNSIVSSRDLVVTVNQVADTPNASITSSINEDGWTAAGIPVTFNASPEDVTANIGSTAALGVEHISHVQAQFNFASLGLPNGTTLTLEIGGQEQTLVSGQWIDITDSYGSAMHVKGVPENWSKDIPVTLQATSSEYDAGGAIVNSATKTVNGSVKIIAVADQPDSFTLADTVTTQTGSAVDLGLSLTLGDHDGSEPAAIYYLVEGVPNGVLLNHGMNTGGGYWIVPYTAGDASWHLTASSNFTGSATIKFYPVITDYDPDGGSDTLHVAAKTVTLTITDSNGNSGANPWPTSTTGIAAPTISGVENGQEDVSFNLGDITATAGDANSAISAIVVTGVQSGASVSGGFYNWITGTWAVAPGSMADLVISPPKDYAGDLTATMKAVAMDANGSYAYSAATTSVVAHLTAVTDGPSVSVSTSLTSGQKVEDVAGIPVTITISQRDIDHSEVLVGSTVTVTIASDAELYLDGVKQTGTNGSYVLNMSDLHVTGNYATGSLSLTGLTVVPPAHYHGSLSIQAAITGNDPGAATPVTTTGSLSVTLTAVADTPTITANGVTGNEDTLIALDVTLAAPDVSGGWHYGSEALSVIITGVPTDGLISGALKNSDGTWTVKDANVSLVQENGVWVAKLTGVSVLAPQDASGYYTLGVTAYTIEPSNHSIATSSANFTVTVNGVADTPTIDPTAVNNGSEDVPLLVNFNAQLLDLSETLSVTITGIPAGASFTDSAGQAIGAAGAGGTWVLQHSDLFNANLSAKSVYFLGNANDAGSWTMTALATSQDSSADGLSHTTAVSNIKTFTVTLAGVADTPILTLTNTATGNEDTGIPVVISAVTPDLVGETLEVLIGGAPAGAVFVNGATSVAVSGDGFWHLPSALLDANLKIKPPANWNGDITLSVQAHTSEGATNGYSDSNALTAGNQTHTLTVHVTAVNDAPDAVLHGATGQSEVAGITTPIYVIPAGQANYVDINDNADGVANPALSRMDISIDKWDGSNTAPSGNHDGISLSGLQPRLDTGGNLVVDFDGHTFGLTYNSGTHTMTLTGSADADTYEDLAKNVILTSTDGTLPVGVRTLGITVYDDAGLTDKVQTTATIGDATHTLNVTLSGDMLGTVQWGANGSVSLLGSSGDDTLVLATSDSVASINGGSGIDQLMMQTAGHGHGDWLFTMDANHDVIATSQSHPDTGGFVVHLTQGTATVDAVHNEVAFSNGVGTVTFNDDHHQVVISQIEKMALG